MHRSDHRVYLCLRNAGQLGYGTLTDVGADQTPAKFTVDLGKGRVAASVVGGYRHTCVLTTDAEVLCFGDGFGGKLVCYLLLINSF